MNPKIIKLKDTQVVIGLEWELLEGTSERKAQRDILKRNPGIKAGVLVRSADIAVLGLMAPGQKKPSVPSGAALLALANQDAQARVTGQSSSIEDNQWIVIERLAEDEYWVVDIKDGVPLPGADFVGSYEKVRTYLNDMLEGAGFKVFTSDVGIQELVDQKAMVVPQGAAEIISALEKPSRGNLKTLSGVDPTIVLVIGVFVLAVAAFFAWDWFKKTSQERARQQQAQQRASEEARRLAAEKQGYVEAIQKAVLDALDQGVNNVNVALQTPAPSEVMGAWVDIVESLPVNHSGWDVQAAECTMETPETPACTIKLKRSSVGINRILLEDFPQAQIAGDDASYVVRGPDLKARSADWHQLSNAQAMLMGLVSDLQFIRTVGLSYSQNESKDITQAVVMPKPPASLFKPGDTAQNAAPAPVNTGVAKGQLGLSGGNLWQVRGLTSYLERGGISALTLNVDLKSKDKQAWQLQTDYLIRSLPAPVLPMVMGPDGAVTVPLPEKYKALTSKEPVQGGVAASQASMPAPAAPTEGTQPVDAPAPSSVPAADEPLSIGLPDAPASTPPTP